MFFQIFTFTVMLLFYISYFSKFFSQRRQNINTDVLGKGKKGYSKAIEIILKITAYLVSLAEIISVIVNASLLPPFFRYMGILLSIIGVSFFICSVITMKDNWRAGVPQNDKTELVSDGIYKISRNPAFVGFDLVYLGVALTFFNPILFVISVFSIVMFHFQIVYVEEPYLEKTFGEDYTQYKRRVCRYIGRKKLPS